MLFSNLFLAAAAVNTAAAHAPASHSHSSHEAQTNGYFNIGYYPTWSPDKTANVNLTYYSHIMFAFGIPQADDASIYMENESIMSDVVPQLHDLDILGVMSLGGWSGSANFSDIFADSGKSDTLIKNICAMIDKYNLDGVDIDYEYPGSPGDTCNVVDPVNDVPNFLKFLSSLRKELDSIWGSKNKTISLAAPTSPWTGSNTSEVQVTDFLDFVDWLDLMLYDINGGWETTTGPNAPFNYQPGSATPVSFVSGINNWIQAGWPADRLVAGLAFYGRSTKALEDMNQDPDNQYQPQNQTAIQGDQDDLPSFDACANATAVSGEWRYENLRKQGVLVTPTSVSEPWTQHWDNITQTPWLYNTETQVYLTYDDVTSIGIKAKYVKDTGLLGTMQWTADMDYNNELNTAIKKVLH